MNIQNNKYLKKAVIISQALHHLEKSILLKEKVILNAEIINLHANKLKLQSLQNDFNEKFIKHLNNFEEIDIEEFEDCNLCIFFSFSPTLSMVQFIKKIKLAGKKIVLIQDNHQFTVHNGAANSIIFKPDLIITASDAEKVYIDKNMFFEDIKVISNGWLFNKQSKNSQNSKSSDNEKKILIAFSAPSEITLVSNETYESRYKIISWVNKAFPEYSAVVKLHPHEDLTSFNSFFENKELIFSLLPSQTSIKKVIFESQIIVASNESQISLDVICDDIDKKIILYSYKKENFLTDDIEIFSNAPSLNQLNIKIGKLNLNSRKKIRDIHLNCDEHIFFKTARDLSELDRSKKDNNSMIDIYLWLYIYGYKTYIIEFLESQKSDRYKNLLDLLKKKKCDFFKLDQQFSSQSTRDPLCIILIRHFLYVKNIEKKDFTFITERFFEEYLVQFFFKDLMRFQNLILSTNLSISMETKYENLLANIEVLYISKFKYFRIFFKLLKKIYALRIKYLNLFILSISDRIFRI